MRPLSSAEEESIKHLALLRVANNFGCGDLILDTAFCFAIF